MLEGWRFERDSKKAARRLEELSDEVSVGIQVVDSGTFVPEVKLPILTPLTDQVRRYLSGPTILFEDVDRTKIKEVKSRILRADSSLSWFLELDRLSLNNLHDLYYALTLNSRLLGPAPELIDIVLGLTNQIPRSAADYDQRDNLEKVSLTREIASGLMTAHSYLKKNESSLSRLM